MSVHGEFQRILGEFVTFLERTGARGGDDWTHQLQTHAALGRENVTEAAKRVLALFQELGVTVREYSKDFMDAAWRESNAYLEEQSADDATFRRVYESYKAFRDIQWAYAGGNELAYQISAFSRI